MPQSVVQVDAFADRPFTGNPAAVCVLGRPRDAAWMQSVALEMNLSETAFLEPADGGWGLRWFTPEVEIDLCGHATLASAHVLWESGQLDPAAEARFHTRSGLLTARRDGEWIWLNFPALPPAPAEVPAGLAEALGAQPVHVGRSRFDVIAEVESEEVVRALKPDLTRLRQVQARGVIVTARGAGGEFDFVSRFFAPQSGVAEDPVTGSAHCVLAPYWAEKLGKREMTAFQASRRGGLVRVRLDGDRVHLGGRAVTVLRGELLD
jgi:PhzF family phenazine biosynthesis protein